jgi:putrescine importer
VFPLIGALVDVYLLSKLDSAALMLGGGWLVIGVVYLLLLTRGLRVRPPEMSLVE